MGRISSAQIMFMDIKTLISQGTLDNSVFKINSQLDRETYVKYNDVLERFGGKWNKKAGGHVFDGDPSIFINLYLTTGELPDKNPLAFFYTPDHVIDVMFAELGSRVGYSELEFLEPSGGTGSIISRLISEGASKITSLEIDPYRFRILENKFKSQENINIINEDFLIHEFDKKFDVVVMNPPFSVEGNTTCYIDHINKAYSLLNEGGMLVSVVPTGWITSKTKKQANFREWVHQNGHYYKLDDKSFKESGTLVGCALIVIEKYTDCQYKKLFEEPACGMPNWFLYNLMLNFDSDSSFYEKKIQLHKKLEQGFDIKLGIEALFNGVIDVMRKNGEFMPMKSEWMDYLIKDFIEDWEKEYK